MSIIALKRRAASTIGVSSGGADGSFSLQGNHRNPSSVIGDRHHYFQVNITCTPEDSALLKSSVMTNSGMLASRFRKRGYPHTVANKSLTDYSHADYLAHIKRQRVAKCPDPAVKFSADGGVGYYYGDSVPNMPAKTGARDYSEWLQHVSACTYSGDAYSAAMQAVAAIAAKTAVADAVTLVTESYHAQDLASDALAETQAASSAAIETQAAAEATALAAQTAAQEAQAALDAALSNPTVENLALAVTQTVAAYDAAVQAEADALTALNTAESLEVTAVVSYNLAVAAYDAAAAAAAAAQTAADIARAYANSF